MKKQDIINLIKYHVDKDEVSFVNTASEIARSFLEDGDEQIAKYIVGLISGPIAYSPQDLSDNYGFFTLIEKETEPLYLPTSLKSDLNGLVNACRSKSGINKIVFEGKPGTGKTQTALMIARALKRELLSVNVSDIIDSRLGQSSKNLVDMFEFANRIAKKGNYVFLFDEIDSLVMDRINNRDLREMGRLTSTFLQELDRLDTNAILIATTNLFESLDRALRRRFDVVISFDCYTKSDLADIASEFLLSYSNNDDFEQSDIRLLKKLIINSNVDLSPAELKNLIRLSLAFTNNKAAFFKRIAMKLGYEFSDIDIFNLEAKGFSSRDLEKLTGKGKSTISRNLKEMKNGL